MDGGAFSCRLLTDPPAAGSWNMAVDEALLAHVAAGDDAVWLRFYQWREPTLSLGYFQPSAAWHEQVRGDCRVVRRQTGGGAILHDRELTYSLVLPPRHPLARGTQQLYRHVHEALLAALGRRRIQAELWPSDEPASEEAYLCFLRRSPGDVVIRSTSPPALAGKPRTARSARHSETAKICGSAQRRRRGALLLHGSLLLSASPCTPQIPGLAELTGARLTAAEAGLLWREELLPVLGSPATPCGDLPDNVRQAAERIEEEKYAACEWTERR